MSSIKKSRRAAAAAPQPRIKTANTSISSSSRSGARARRQVDAFRSTGRVNNRRLSEEERIALEIAAIEAQYAHQNQQEQEELTAQAPPAQVQIFKPSPQPTVAPASVAASSAPASPTQGIATFSSAPTSSTQLSSPQRIATASPTHKVEAAPASSSYATPSPKHIKPASPTYGVATPSKAPASTTHSAHSAHSTHSIATASRKYISDADEESDFDDASTTRESSSDEDSEFESYKPPPKLSRKKGVACKANKRKRAASPDYERPAPPKRTKIHACKANKRKRAASPDYERPAPPKRTKVHATREVEVSTLRKRSLQELEDPTVFWNAITHVDLNLPKRRRVQKGLYKERVSEQEAAEEREKRERQKQKSEEARIKRAQVIADYEALKVVEAGRHLILRDTKLQEDVKALLAFGRDIDESLDFNGPISPQSDESTKRTPIDSPEPKPNTKALEEQKKAAGPVYAHSVLAHYTKQELADLLAHIDEEDSKSVMASLTSPSHKVVEMKLNISQKAGKQMKNDSLAKKGKRLSGHKQRNVEKVVFGDVAFPAWFPSAYPVEVPAAGEAMYLCAKCFHYHPDAETAVKHRRVCKRHIRGQSIPGEKIYQHGSNPFSVWRVRGDDEENKLYLQGLCLFAKMFIDSKTVMFDVVAFDYYLLVHTSSEGDQQVVGYYSKQRQAWDEYNLACVMIFPPWQQKGLGAILTNLAYEIGIKQGLRGGPERPISDVGHKGYMKVWGDKICPFLLDLPETDSKKGTGKIDVDRIHRGTGVSVMDILDFFVTMGEHQGRGMPKYVFMKKNGAPVKRYDADWNKTESLLAEADGTVYHLIIDKEDIRAWMHKHGLGMTKNIDREMIDFPAALKM